MTRDDDVPGLSDLASKLRRRWAYVATIAPAVILLSVYLAFAIPPEYRSSATIMLEPSSVQADLVQTTVASYANQQIEIVQGRVMTVTALKALVEEFDPYPEDSVADSGEKALRIIRATTFERVDPVTLKTLQESTAFSLHYDNPDPERAAKVAAMLADLFVTYNQRTRVESARQAAAFLAQEAEAVRTELRQVDDQLAQLKVRYGDAVPDSQFSNQAGVERAQRDLRDLQRDIRQAEERENLLTLQLNQISPNLVALGGDLTDLGKVKAQLAEAEQRYTPDHPDVRRLRRAMEDLIARNASGAGTAVKPNNPEYLLVASQREGVRRELQALRASASRVNEQLDTYMRDIRISPTVEREFSEINRRRELLQNRFQEVQTRLQTAQLAQSFEAESRGERFTMVRDPFPARLPVYPNRVGLILLGLVLAGGLTAVAIAIAESADSTVRDASDFPVIQGAALLGSIPVILTAGDKRKRMLVRGFVACIYGAAIAAVGYVVAGAA